MTHHCLSRRQLLITAGAAAGIAVTGVPSFAGAGGKNAGIAEPKRTVSFRYCFNTGTIRGQKLGVVKEIEIVARAGYDSIELWIDGINNYIKSGGTLKELRNRIADLGLTLEDAIGFAPWIVDDDTERAKGLEQAKRDMDMLAQIGGKRIAAPPVGATEKEGLDLGRIAERYRTLLELGSKTGIVPQLEIWGASKNISRLSQAAFVVIESGHPKACLLADVYHIYKGGSDFNGLKMLSAEAIQVFHLNDYPAEPPREKINDRDRIYPGDGVAPLAQILRNLHANGGQTILSLELFNPNYYKQDPLEVAKTGLGKMKAAVEKAVA